MSADSIEAVPHGADLVATVPHLTVIPAPEPDDITWHQADEITRKIRSALLDLTAAAACFAALIERAWACRADQALGYDSWAAYCEDIFAVVRGVTMPPEARAAIVAALTAAGMSSRAVASAIGVGQRTVIRDRTATEPSDSDDSLTVMSLDGRRRPAAVTPTDKPKERKTDLAIASLTAAGGDGLTITELARKRRWTYPQTSPTLSRLERQHRVTRTGERRDGYSVYAVAT